MTWGARSLSNFRRRRRPVFATSNKRPYTKQPRELVRLSVEDRRAGRREIAQTLIFIAAEVLDILLDMSNFIFFINDSSARSYRTYRCMYIACTVLVTTFALYVLVKHITHLHHIRAEILVGIHVTKGRRSLMERSRSSEVMPADLVRESLECDDDSDLEEQAANVFPETAQFPNENILVEKPSISSQSGVDSFEDANASQQRVLELELERLQRRSTRAKLIVIGAFAEDLTTLLFALYRVGFTSYIVDEDFARCLLTNTSRAPVLCVSHQLGLVLLQLLGSTLLFALKVSFARDYYTLRSLARGMQEALRRETTQESSTLDLYKDGQVTTREINKVVQIRNICAFPGHSRYASDWLILQFLRLNRGDQVAAAQAVQSLLAWRRKHGASTIRRQLLTRDMAWDDIPNLSKINSVLPFVDAFKLDEQNAQLVQYAYIGSRADYPCLLRLIREEDLLKCALYLAERSLLLLESISNRLGRVHELTILCDARGSPDEFGLLLFMRMLKSVCESLSHYPLRPKLILWKPSAELAELVRAYPPVHIVNSTKMLRILLSVECIPEELSGELRFGKQSEMLSKVDPWQLRQCRFAPLSRVLGHSEIDIHFYHDVSSAEANAVVSLRRLLAVIEKQVRNGSTMAAPASTYRSRGIMRRGNSTTQSSFNPQDISLPALRNRMKTFRAEGGALYKVSAEVASHLMLLRFVRKYMSAAELKHYEEILSLRFDPHTFTRAPLGILAAAIAYVDTLIWRLRSKLDSLNARIKSEKMALCESFPHVATVCDAAKLRPLMGFDSEHAQILAFFVEDAHPSYDASQNPLTQDMIMSACAALFEYWLIILHALSAQEERVVCVREFSHLDSSSRCIARPWADFHQVMQSLCSHYPLCIKSDGVMLVRRQTRGAHFACRFKRALSIIWQNTNWTKPTRTRRGLTLEDATNLAKTVSPTMIPKDLGGSSEFKDVGNESLGTALAKYSTALQQALPIWSAPEGSPVDRFDGLPGRSGGQGGGPLVLRDSVKMYMPIKLPRFYTDSHINRTAQSPAEKSPLAMLMKGHTLQTLTATQHPPKAASESAPAPS